MEFVKFLTVLAWVVFSALTFSWIAAGIYYWSMTPLARRLSVVNISKWHVITWVVALCWLVSRYL